MLKVRGLKKRFGDLQVLKGIDLDVHEGDVISILGPSGSGKTTFLRCLEFLERADEGKLTLDETSIRFPHADRQRMLKIRRKCGFVFQDYSLFRNRTALENISEGLVYGHGMDKAQARARAAQLLDQVSMGAYADYYPSQLSGGQQQRVGIARALASSPDILLMDEPFGAVDSITRSQLQSEIKTIHDQTGITVVFITHDLREALYLGTRVLILDQGEIRQLDTPRNILSHPADDFVRSLIANSFHDLNALKNERSVQQ